MIDKAIHAIKKYRYLYIMLIPVMSFYIIMHYLPMYGIIISFKNFDILEGILNSPWAGLKYFKQVFGDTNFWNAVRNTFIINGYKLFFAFPVPIIMSLMLNEIKSTKFKRITQTIIYLPHFVSWVVIGGIMLNFLSIYGGPVNRLIEILGGEPIFFMASKEHFRSLLVISHIWRNAGWSTIIYIAALTGINPELYEAAKVDGANRFRQMLHITLPGIMSTIVIMLILNISRILKIGFDQVVVLYNPVVWEVSDILQTYVYRTGLQQGRYSYAAAAGLFESVVAFILIFASDRLAKAVGEKGLF